MKSRYLIYLFSFVLIISCFDTTRIDLKNKRSIFNYFKKKNHGTKKSKSLSLWSKDKDKNVSVNNDNSELQ